MPYLVRLKPNWPSNFRRSIRRDPKTEQQVLAGGEIVGVLEFSPGDVAELTEEEFRAVSADFGVCLEHMRLDEKGRPRVSEDPFEVTADPTPETASPLQKEHGTTERPPTGRQRAKKKPTGKQTDNTSV